MPVQINIGVADQTGKLTFYGYASPATQRRWKSAVPGAVKDYSFTPEQFKDAQRMLLTEFFPEWADVVLNVHDENDDGEVKMLAEIINELRRFDTKSWKSGFVMASPKPVKTFRCSMLMGNRCWMPMASRRCVHFSLMELIYYEIRCPAVQDWFD